VDVDRLVEKSRKDRKPRPAHPKGWEPGAVLDENAEGFLTTRPRTLADGELVKPDAEPWEHHLRRAGLDPSKVEVVPPVEVRTWDMNLGEGRIETAVYFKAKIIARQTSVVDEELRKFILKWKPRKPQTVAGTSSFVVPWADWQVGKNDGDGGTEGTIRRLLDMFDRTVDRFKHLSKTHDFDQIVVCSLGDLIENCAGFYAQQTFTVDRNLREQERIVRRLITQGLKTFADLAPVVVLPVGGNHGENRANGKSFTDFGDNWDVGLFEPVAELMGENPRFDNVGFHIPDADLTQTIDVHGTILGLVHGHQAKGGGKPHDKMMRWWDGQARGRLPIGDADVLLVGHHHHLMVREYGPRTIIQCPAMDGGSEWFADMTGEDSPPAAVTFTVGADGWSNFDVMGFSRE